MIEIKDVGYAYKGKEHFAVRDMSFGLEKGLITCMLGHNGAGKTTILKIIAGVLRPDCGEILYHGVKVDKGTYPDYRKEVAYFDKDWCIANKTIRFNVDFFRPLYGGFDEKCFDELMKRFRMAGTDDKIVSELSSGQKVKFAIAFYLATKPSYIILDEPLATLDPVVKTEIVEVLSDEARGRDMGVLISTHLLEEISDVTDYIVMIEDGKLVLKGDRESVFESYGATRLSEVFCKR
ncbi:MAG TPA: hypothetical protein DEO82_05180 [Eubacterium sp.]|nr:hypothetical protein [Eubacterium sp.]